jgi:hypothetical protein
VFSTHPAAGDVFWCRLVSSDACALRDTVNSNVLTITVNPVITPSVLLTVSPNDTVAYAGQVLVFTAHATNCGGVPVYTWFVNGTLVAGATDSVYSRPVLANDTVYCVVTCSAPCTATPYNRTNTIVANGTPLGFADPVAGGASFFIYPNPNSGSFLLSGIYEGGTLCYIVTDMTGRQISTGALFTESGALNQKISLDGVEPGMYILDIITRYSRIRLVCNIVYMQ